jgi:hypothetical protein
MLNDLHHATRLLTHAKGWTAVRRRVAGTGHWGQRRLFGAVNGKFLRKIPVRDPESLVRLRMFGRNDMSNNSNDYGFSPLVGACSPSLPPGRAGIYPQRM